MSGKVVGSKTIKIDELEMRIFAIQEDFKDKDFVKVFDLFTRALIEDKEIAGKSIRLLFYIIDKLEINNDTIYLDPKEVSNKLDITTQTFHTWKKILLEKGIINKIATNLYKINYYYICKGRIKNFTDKEMDEKIKQISNQ